MEIINADTINAIINDMKINCHNYLTVERDAHISTKYNITFFIERISKLKTYFMSRMEKYNADKKLIYKNTDSASIKVINAFKKLTELEILLKSTLNVCHKHYEDDGVPIDITAFFNIRKIFIRDLRLSLDNWK